MHFHPHNALHQAQQGRRGVGPFRNTSRSVTSFVLSFVACSFHFQIHLSSLHDMHQWLSWIVLCLFISQANRCLWVAEQGQEIVGLTAVHIGPEGAPTSESLTKHMLPDHGMLFRISTKATCRRQGVGMKLMVSFNGSKFSRVIFL